MSEYTVFNEKQLEWVKKVAVDMTSFTMKWNASDELFSDEDFESIIDRFKWYTEKSRNNKFVIDIGISFLTYLEEKESYKRKNIKSQNSVLNNEQFCYIEKFMIKAFELLKEYCDKELNEYNVVQFENTLIDYSKDVPDNKLLKDLISAMKAYINFCKDNQKVLQPAEMTEKRNKRNCR